MEREMTLSQVRDGIIMALRAAYPTAAIFSDAAPQQVVDGSFNVVFVSSSELGKLMDYRVQSATFDVVYYADRSNMTDDMLRVCTDLPLLLATITTPSGAKTHPSSDVTPIPQDDGTLHCVVRFTYHVIARRVQVDEFGNEIPYNIHGEPDDTDLMRHLHLHLYDEEQ